ncbi:MAG: hypothetical protein HC895_23220 [Leptolyngbyaceae cyanobacterium SM1_3_5]|nr:hypothetical protein [Leptolyngbyaceae cyanobacterium SM1_3_5]
MSRYYDIAARQGFHALIDALIDSREYTEAFSEDTVPHDRYHTPRTHEVDRACIPRLQCPAEGDRVFDRTWMQQAMERWKAQLNGHSTKAPASELPQPLQSVISQISEETTEESADVAPPTGEMQGSRETADAV